MAVNCPSVCGHCLSGNWRQYSQKIFVIIYLLITLVVMALTIWVTVEFSNDTHVYFWFVAGISVQLAIAISLWNIFNHLVYYTRPSLQKYIVRMIGIIPAHSINCWMAIRYKETAIYFDTIRNFYQALVIYSFMSLLLTYLNETFDNLEKILICKPKFKPQPPCCCVKAVPNRRLISRCRAGVLNYVIIHPLITVIAIITEITGHYIEGSFVGIWIWLTVIDAISQVWAMYCLMIFYRATRDELQGLRPVGKLIAVQLTIFGSFFQNLVINLVIGLINPTLDPEWNFTDNQEFMRFIQDFILCIEMSISAAGHLYAFPYTIYIQEGVPHNFCKSCVSCCSVTDITRDVVTHVKRMSKNKSNLAKQIEYEQYDDDQHIVELDDVAIVRQDDTNTDASHSPPSHGETITNHTTVNDTRTSEINDVVDVAVVDGVMTTMSQVDVHAFESGGGGVRSVRHDSGSYSAHGEIGGNGGSEDGVIVSERESPTSDRMYNQQEQDVGDIDMALQARTVASIDGLPSNMEFNA